MRDSEPTTVDAGRLLDTPMRIGVVSLRVRDLKRVADYYRRALGLEALEAAADRVTLGAADTPLLELLGDPTLRARDPRDAGLFHTAFLMPTRGDLASWLRHAGAERLPLTGASDHFVSEAIYLSDPEGNGVEVYADRPRTAWPVVDGVIGMGTERLDVDDLVRADPNLRWRRAPHGLVIGHIHLQAGAVPPADAFYANLLGFDITCRYPGASFFGAGGYHHQIAANTWNSLGSGAIDRNKAGLEGFEILVRDAETLSRLSQQATTRNAELRDPWGVTIALKAP
jgi:catechol 2,3-dioxygenase